MKIKRKEVREIKGLRVLVVTATVLLLTEGHAMAGKEISLGNYPNIK